MFWVAIRCVYLFKLQFDRLWICSRNSITDLITKLECFILTLAFELYEETAKEMVLRLAGQNQYCILLDRIVYRLILDKICCQGHIVKFNTFYRIEVCYINPFPVHSPVSITINNPSSPSRVVLYHMNGSLECLPGLVHNTVSNLHNRKQISSSQLDYFKSVTGLCFTE